MYLARLEIENFRIFGEQATGEHCSLLLEPGLNVLLGENDSGKTCVVDAIRLVLGTTPIDRFALTADDFHCKNGVRAKRLSIEAQVRDLSLVEAAAFLEHLSIRNDAGRAEFVLTVCLTAEYDSSLSRSSRRPPIRYEWRAGGDAEGPRIEAAARELLRTTYLRPLRDAVSELTARKGSRLAQVLHSYPEIAGHEVNDWDPVVPNHQPKTLTGIMRRAEEAIRESSVVSEAKRKLDLTYLRPLSLGLDPLSAKISISPHDLRQILERLELTLGDHEPGATRGLGLHNILFMAAELLALERDSDPCLPLVLIEEPEAHLHPQLQLRLVKFLSGETQSNSERRGLQVILTSHSPNIASKVRLERVTLMHRGRVFPLRSSITRLDASDYEFLERFLDTTRADLFFARGLLIVEGDSEAILLPTIAELIGSSLTEHGVSVINVGSVGLFRYSRIFQRSDGVEMPVRVACLADRDIPPDEAKALVNEDRKTEGDFTQEDQDAIVAALKDEDGGAVRTFVSDHWTFEYDLAHSGLAREVHAAATIATAVKNRRRALRSTEYRNCLFTAFREYRRWIAEGKTPTAIAVLAYAPLLAKRASKPETAQHLAHILRATCKKPSFDLRGRLPQYLLDALSYATRSKAPPDEGEGAARDEIAPEEPLAPA